MKIDDDTIADIDCQSIDRKIPAGQILLQRTNEFNRFRMPVVSVFSVYAECGDFKTLFAIQNGHRTVLDSSRDDRPEQCGDFVGCGVGSKIEIGTRPSQQVVPDCPSDDEELVALLCKAAGEILDWLGNREPDHAGMLPARYSIVNTD
ncbi:hypothetical protein SDC9_144967 [bioreactor metagenome]|uniref:Uncharacterized protein n=1 Tax=bioreactor metagenome TaxID=1076179 RepID=A0A645E7Q9_9ZZZZ